MKTAKLGLKLLGVHVLMSFMEMFLMPSMLLMWGNIYYHWLVGIIYIVSFWLAIYSSASKQGLTDAKNESFVMYKGFLAGIIASIPGIVFLIIANVFAEIGPLFQWFLQVFWLSPYRILFDNFEEFNSIITYGALAIFPLVTGFSYLYGLVNWKKILETLKK